MTRFLQTMYLVVENALSNHIAYDTHINSIVRSYLVISQDLVQFFNETVSQNMDEISRERDCFPYIETFCKVIQRCVDAIDLLVWLISNTLK